MNDNTNASNGDTLYELLGVPETATPEEIKRAYFASVRQRRPDAFPELFQKLTESMRVLGDVQKRGEYDQTRRGGRRVQALLDQAAGVLDKDPQKALTTLKGAIAIAPDLPRPRLLLAQTLFRLGEWAGAEKQYRWLLRTGGKSETLHVKLARCLLKQDRLAEAHQEVLAALALSPVWYDAHFLQAAIYEAQENWSSAAASLEAAIQSDGRENFADFDALVRLWEVFHRAGVSEETIAASSLRIVSTVPLPTGGEDPEADALVARAVLRLCDRAGELSEMGRDALASALLFVAARIEGADHEAQSRMADLQTRTVVLFEARQAQSDVLIAESLRDSIYLKYLDRRGSDAGRQTRLENVLADLQNEINAQPKALHAALDYLKKEYPRLAQAEEAFLGVLSARAVRRMEVLNGTPGQASPASSMPGGSNNGDSTSNSPPTPVANTARPNGGILGWLRGG